MSTAMVRLKRDVPEIDADLPLECRLFLETFMRTRRLGVAAKILGNSTNQHKVWLGDVRGKEHLLVPGYPEAFEVALEDVKVQEDDLLLDVVEKGLKEVTTDGDGNIKHIRYRQSEGIYKLYLQALNREKYAPERTGGDNNVVIIINRPKEGGWGE